MLIGILTDRSRERSKDPSWEQNEDVRLNPESIGEVRSHLFAFALILFVLSCLYIWWVLTDISLRGVYRHIFTSRTKIARRGRGSLISARLMRNGEVEDLYKFERRDNWKKVKVHSSPNYVRNLSILWII